MLPNPSNTPPAPQPRTITANDPLSWIEDIFANYTRPAGDDWPFDLLVIVCGRLNSPGPRDQRWEYILDHGMPLIDRVLKGEPIGPGPHFFIFPDRWLVPGEAQIFGHRLPRNPDANKFDRVYIVTHQPYIVSDCRREQVRILTTDSSSN